VQLETATLEPVPYCPDGCKYTSVVRNESGKLVGMETFSTWDEAKAFIGRTAENLNLDARQSTAGIWAIRSRE
jgi:hypothetical protein